MRRKPTRGDDLDRILDVDRQLRRQLIGMADNEQRLCAAVRADGAADENDDPRLQALRDRRAPELAAISTKHGWPGERLVGRAGAEAALLIARHATARPALELRCARLRDQAVRAGNVAPPLTATQSDLVRQNEPPPS